MTISILPPSRLFKIMLFAFMSLQLVVPTVAFSSLSIKTGSLGKSMKATSVTVVSWPRCQSDCSVPSTALFAEPPQRNVNDIIGIQRGLYLLGIVFLFNIWIFSIPPEFRRAKICSEEQVRLFPDSGCMTADQWVGGIQDYYANGGGIEFDFSIEKSRQPSWMGGDQPFQK